MLNFSRPDWRPAIFLMVGLGFVGFGAAAVTAWHFPEENLLRPFLAVPYGTAWAFGLSGVTAALVAVGHTGAARMAAASVIVLGALRVAGYLGRADSAAQIRYADLLGMPGSEPMTPLAALCFVLAGCALVAISPPRRGVTRSMVGTLLCTAVLSLSLIALFGYLSGSRFVYDWLQFGGGEVPTFIGLLILGSVVLLYIFSGKGPEQLALRRWAPLPMWFGVFLGTLFLWQALKAHEYRQIQNSVAWAGTTVRSQIAGDVEARLRAIRRLATRWQTYAPIQEEWEADATEVLADYPEFAAINWANASSRVRWVVPREGSERVLGFDLTSEPRRAAALQQALRDRDVTLTQFVDLVIGGVGALVYAPIFTDAGYDGVVVGVFRIQDLLEALVREGQPGYSVTLYEGDRKIYEVGVEDEALAQAWGVEQIVSVYNVDWRLRIAPTRQTLEAAHSALPDAALGGGLALAALLALLVYLFQTSRLHAHQLETANQGLLREAEERARVQGALRESEERNRLIVESIKDYAIFLLDPEGRIASWNSGAEQLNGYRAAEAVGRPLALLYPPESEVPRIALEAAARHGRFEEECWHVRRDGSRYCGDDVITAIRDDKGELRGFSNITQDATQRTALREGIKKSRDFYLKLLGDFPNPVWRTDSLGNLEYFNQAWLDFTGRRLEDELKNGWLAGVHPDDREFFTGVFRRAFAAREMFQMEFRLRRQDGDYGWILAIGKPFYDMDGEFAGYIGSCYDITERRTIETALRDSESHYEAMTSNVPGVVFQLLRRGDGSLYFPYVSRGVREVCEVDADAIESDPDALFALLADDDRPRFEAALGDSAHHLTTWIVSGRITTPSGKTRWISVKASPNLLASGEVLWDGILFDDTQSRMAQFEIERSHEQLKALSLHLETIREDEKARIAREIHDELGGTLTALKMDIFWLANRVPGEPKTIPEKIRGMGALVDSAVNTTRRIATELRPTILDDLGLVAALTWQASEFQKRTRIVCKLNVDPEIVVWDKDVSITFFRIFQETLTNIARHANAKRVQATFKNVNSRYVLKVRDDGIGIDHEQVIRPTSHGIRGMLERARHLGGQFSIVGVPGQGTTVTISIPKPVPQLVPARD